ncbi:MAG: glycosyltransferase [Ferruginibacter sp.]
MNRLIFTVTNDLTYDQRMIRICTSLGEHGDDVLLVGRKLKDSVPLKKEAFRQKRLYCFFNKGKLFYAEYNTRLFFFLLFIKMDLICAIDLDTILPCYFISKLRKKKRVYDAHELFCEMKEIVIRPAVYKMWKRIEKYTIPHFTKGYTVNQVIADEFKKMYGVQYEVIRSIAVLRPLQIPEKKERYILYQGAVNEGRSFETLIPAMKDVDAKLIICGDGNFMDQAKALVQKYQLADKVIFKGKLPPDELRNFTINAYIGVTLFENNGISNYYSLANRFFDYLHAAVPQVCVDFPVYKEINNLHGIAVLIPDNSVERIAAALNELLSNDILYHELQQHCLKAREILNWQEEERRLVLFYSNLLIKN